MIRLTQDLKSTRWIYAKGILFALLSVIAAVMLISIAPRLDIAVLLLICVWASCRAYYFAFYVIEHYVDSSYRFSGLFDFAKYLFCRDRDRFHSPDDHSSS
jgi:hypothetical protein